MLELHDCIYCGQPLVVNTTSGKVFNISCGHFEQEVMFYMVQGVGVPTGAVHHATAAVAVEAPIPTPKWDATAIWIDDLDEEDE